MSDRMNDIQWVIEDTRARRAAGERPRLSEITSRHPELHPDLGRELARVFGPDTDGWEAEAAPDACLGISTIRALLAGQLPLGLSDLAHRHLERCLECSEERDFQQGMAEIVREADRPPLVDRHELLQPLGRGGHGTVWAARHVGLGQERAIKVLRTDRFTPAAVAALRREARTLAALPSHPNRIQVYDLADTEDGPALVMGYVRGGPLARRAPCPWPDALRYVDEAAAALSEVHTAGSIHGDITPNNLLWDFAPLLGRNRAVLSDFGLAARADAPGHPAGTPGYMAPEVAHGTRTYATDVFGLAATLFGLTVGRPPYSPIPLAQGLLEARRGPDTLQHALADLPAGVQSVIQAGLAPEPTQRPTLAEFRKLICRVDTAAVAESLRKRSGYRVPPVRLTVAVTPRGGGETTGRPQTVLFNAAEGEPADGSVLQIRQGEVIGFEVTSDVPGYLTVLNIHPTEGTSTLGPVTETPVAVGQLPYLLELVAHPTAEVETAAFVWTAAPSRLDPLGWRERLLSQPTGATTRPLNVVWSSADRDVAKPDGWVAVLVRIQEA